MTNEYNEFESPESSYHFTNRDDLPRDDYRPAAEEPAYSAEPYRAPEYRTPAPAVEEPAKKSFFRRTGVKVCALLLAVAMVAGLCGYGGAALARSSGSSSARTSVKQSQRSAVDVSVKRVDGHSIMTSAEVYAAAVNSVVSINSTSRSTNVFGQPVESASAGSGFIITADGYIVTNHHVVKGATSVKVTLYNGETYDAEVVGGDSDYDVAVLKIKASGLQAMTLGSSADLNVGDTVLAIGNPLGELTFSMSQGIVSCCDRAINVDGTPFNMIQVDASINPGNSGGPLLNLYGEVVGIVSAKYSSYSSTTVEGLGFAIPMDDVQTIITDIMENGQVTNKAYLAITAGTMTESMAAQYRIGVTKGVFVYSAVEGGAGEKAGLKMGDVITKVNDTEITSMEDLSAVKKGFKAGDTVTLTVYRDGTYITTELTFDAQPETTGQEEEEQPQQIDPWDGSQMPDGWEEFYKYFFGNNPWGGWGN
ncbi:MAG: trypsin-like peptidase domain-containing protein [Oscillospiraceae bacterium]|nr:trypsin-like peptidase domain-containing protein [Oscillospiraceae bacterium]